MGIFNVFRKTPDKEEKGEITANYNRNDLIENAEGMLAEVNVDLSKMDAVKLPIAQLGALGGGIASLLPSLRTITSNFIIENENLYQVVFPNGVKGHLATTHIDGLNIGTIINKKGIAGQARLIKASPQEVMGTTKLPINPTTLMMAAAIVAIEQKLDEILKMEQEILSFLEEDKEAKIEGDLKTLTTIIKEYKFNWDNGTYTATHHQLAADIKRDAEANMIFYQKQVADSIKDNPALFAQQFVVNTQATLLKKFKYYRLSLYLYGFASFIEVMLQGQYEQGYVEQVRQDIIDRSAAYKETYDTCFKQLEKLTASSVEHHVLKGLGAAGKAVGSFIGSIPVIKDGQVDEWLIQNGTNLEQNGDAFGKDTLKQFEAISDPGSSLFIDNLYHVNRLFNQTNEIYIGKDNIYLVKEAAV